MEEFVRTFTLATLLTLSSRLFVEATFDNVKTAGLLRLKQHSFVIFLCTLQQKLADLRIMYTMVFNA